MQITILGSGTCVPSQHRSSCALLLATDHHNMLFDLGVGTIHRLLARGVRIDAISHIFLSHFHPDHTAELVPFLFSGKYGGFAPRPLNLLAGPGLKRFYEGLQAVYGSWIELPPGLLTLHETVSGSYIQAFEGIVVEAQAVHHNPESLAWRITDRQARTMVYSGDTDACEGLLRIARQADVFICECAFPNEMKVAGHLTPEQAGTIAHEAGVRQLVLTHFYPACDQVDLVQQCRQTYRGPLILATDLLQIHL